MKRKFFRNVLLFGLAFTLAVAPCGCAGDKEDKASSSIKIGIQQDIEESLDPHDMLAAGTKEIFFNVFEGLVKPDNEGNIVPAVASSVSKSEDGCTYTFEIRQGIMFMTEHLLRRMTLNIQWKNSPTSKITTLRYRRFLL